MPNSPVILETAFGRLELRQPRTPGEQSKVPLAMCEDSVRWALEDALAFGDASAVMNLAHEGGFVPLAFGVDDDEVVAGLMEALSEGRLVAGAPGEGGGDDQSSVGWAAYYRFQARFGKEFMVAMRKHRIVATEQVHDIRRNEDYDVVPAREASGIVVRMANAVGKGPWQSAAETLAKHIVDLRSPPVKATAFMLLRAPPSLAERLVSPEEVVTPAKLKKLKEQKEAVYELEIERRYHDDSPVVGAAFTIEFENGSKLDGVLSEKGNALIKGVPNQPGLVTFAPDARAYSPSPVKQGGHYKGRVPSDADMDERVTAFLQGAALQEEAANG